MSNLRQIPLTCSGHTRPVVHLDFNRDITECGYFLISACKGKWRFSMILFDWFAVVACDAFALIQFHSISLHSIRFESIELRRHVLNIPITQWFDAHVKITHVACASVYKLLYIQCARISNFLRVLFYHSLLSHRTSHIQRQPHHFTLFYFISFNFALFFFLAIHTLMLHSQILYDNCSSRVRSLFAKSIPWPKICDSFIYSAVFWYSGFYEYFASFRCTQNHFIYAVWNSLQSIDDTLHLRSTIR